MREFNVIGESNNSTVVSEYNRIERKSESYQSEDALEQELISSLCDQSYEYLAFSSEEELIHNLRIKLEQLNNYKFSDQDWEKIFTQRIANTNFGIAEKTNVIQKDYKIDFTDENGESLNIYLLDKKNIHKNSLQVINQYEVEGTYKNRYDVTILVNGLPLVHIELKRRGVELQQAYNQIERYKRDSFWAGSGLFEYVQLFVISNGTYTKYYSNSSRETHVNSKYGKRNNTFEFTSFWADAKNNPIYDLVDFTKTFLTKHTLLNVICKYCIFTSDEKLMVMRPYQIVACECIINRVEMASNYKMQGKTEAGGFIWHTTGSGKTLTSFKTAVLCSERENISKVIFVVDRKDLDYQTMKEYDKFEKNSANSNSSTKVLTKQLEDPSARIIITTIQKLSNFVGSNHKHPIYDQDVVMIFDECHRSQFGDMHKVIVKNFKKYYLFGFTGTPIFPINHVGGKSFKTTEQIFGDCLHQYTLKDAINDKNVLKFKVDFIKTVDTKADISDKEVAAINTKGVLEHEDNIRNIVEYILEHYAAKTKSSSTYVHSRIDNVERVAKSKQRKDGKKISTNVSGFNSMFACSGIEMVKKYYEEFKNHDHNLKIATIFSYSANEAVDDVGGITDENNENTNNLDKSSRDFLENAIKDYNEMFGTSYDTSSDKFQNYYKDVSMRMKNKEIDILIVSDMFLTGFDAPTLNTLWVDKNLKYHGLIQAFSRTNRILNSVKTHGNIVCFRNLEEEMNEAVSLFSDSNSSGIILMKTYEEYYNGYAEDGILHKGYTDLINELREFGLDQRIESEAEQKKFVKIYSQIIKLRNILGSFDQFENDTLISKRDIQDYQSMYIEINNEFKKLKTSDKEDIYDDVVFEIELIKQVQVNIDYILELISKYCENNKQDKEIRADVMRAVNSSISLRNKRDLIEDFIDSITPSMDVHKSFENYINEEKTKELNVIIQEEKLNPEETEKFIGQAFKSGALETYGTGIVKIMPAVSRFAVEKENANKKQIVIGKLLNFFDRFYDISNDGM